MTNTEPPFDDDELIADFNNHDDPDDYFPPDFDDPPDEEELLLFENTSDTDNNNNSGHIEHQPGPVVEEDLPMTSTQNYMNNVLTLNNPIEADRENNPNDGIPSQVIMVSTVPKLEQNLYSFER
jgi:hypothetical protein